MTTQDDELSDIAAVRMRFLEAVVASPRPITGRHLTSGDLNRRAAQKRLDRLRDDAGGGPSISDDELVAYTRRELERLHGPLALGRARLRDLASPEATRFAEAAEHQGTVIDGWIELAHSPGDRGWSRSEISVEELGRGSLFARGNAQSWLTEKKRYMKQAWSEARSSPGLLGRLVPNQLKMDLVGFKALGTGDATRCAIRIAPIDWQSCLALNARLDQPALTVEDAAHTVRERWGGPRQVVERRGLPGMFVGHIVVETVDRRLLVCQRQTVGIEDERGAWSLSIEERWSGRLHQLTSREGQVIQKEREPDLHPHDVVRRALKEELGVTVEDGDVRVLSWGLEPSVLYPGFIAIARTPLGSWEVEGLRPHAEDANELRFVTSIPASLDSLGLLNDDTFAPPWLPDRRQRWHRTARARLFAALTHILTRDIGGSREDVLRELGRL